MGAGHSHAPSTQRRSHPSAGWDEQPWWRRRTTELVLILILAPILTATAFGAVTLWPHGKPPLSATIQSGPSVPMVEAEIISTRSQACPGTSEDRLPDGTLPAETTCAYADVKITSGTDIGQRITVAIPPPVFRSGVSHGTMVQLAGYPLLEDDSEAASDPETASDPAADPLTDALADPSVDPEDTLGVTSTGNVYAWQDYSRESPLTWMAIAFAVLVVLVARLRGIAALLGLGLAALAIDRFMLPALQFGENPVAVALVTSIGLMTVLLYLAHGMSNRTTTALLGTIFGLVVAAAGADWATGAAHLTGLGSEDNYSLSTLTSQADLSGVVLCGIIIASLGVLNDVTVTQASAVWEIAQHSQHPTWGKLFASGMRVGRDHLASTVYTIVFAYAGTALPTLLLINIYQRPLGQVLTSSDIAEELTRTFIGAGGLILAIPLTTALAALLVLREAGVSSGPELNLPQGPGSTAS
jgi:uncharacterized membrane protein